MTKEWRLSPSESLPCVGERQAQPKHRQHYHGRSQPEQSPSSHGATEQCERLSQPVTNGDTTLLCGAPDPSESHLLTQRKPSRQQRLPQLTARCLFLPCSAAGGCQPQALQPLPTPRSLMRAALSLLASPSLPGLADFVLPAQLASFSHKGKEKPCFLLPLKYRSFSFPVQQSHSDAHKVHWINPHTHQHVSRREIRSWHSWWRHCHYCFGSMVAILNTTYGNYCTHISNTEIRLMQDFSYSGVRSSSHSVLLMLPSASMTSNLVLTHAEQPQKQQPASLLVHKPTDFSVMWVITLKQAGVITHSAGDSKSWWRIPSSHWRTSANCLLYRDTELWETVFNWDFYTCKPNSFSFAYQPNHGKVNDEEPHTSISFSSRENSTVM